MALAIGNRGVSTAGNHTVSGDNIFLDAFAVNAAMGPKRQHRFPLDRLVGEDRDRGRLRRVPGFLEIATTDDQGCGVLIDIGIVEQTESEGRSGVLDERVSGVCSARL